MLCCIVLYLLYVLCCVVMYCIILYCIADDMVVPADTTLKQRCINVCIDVLSTSCAFWVCVPALQAHDVNATSVQRDDVNATSHQRWCNVMMLMQRRINVGATS